MHTWRYAVIWASCAVGIALAVWLRFGWIENPPVANACFAHGGSLGCAARAAAIVAFQHGWFSIAAGIAGALALAWKHPLSAWLAVLAGGVALTLYSDEIGAAALLVGVLRLVRLQLRRPRPPGREYGSRQQHIAERP